MIGKYLRNIPDIPLFDNLAVRLNSGRIMRPTDIDMILDYRVVIWLNEFKRWGVELTEGQRILMERLADSSKLLIICTVSEYVEADKVGVLSTYDAATAVVTKVYYGDRKWQDIRNLDIHVLDVHKLLTDVILNGRIYNTAHEIIAELAMTKLSHKLPK